MEVETYSDGSCGASGDRSGGCAAVLDFVDGSRDSYAVYSCEAGSTIGRMELAGAIIALREILAISAGGDPVSILMTLDSEVTTECMTGIKRRRTNVDLWGEYNRVSHLLPEGSVVSVRYLPRNSNAMMASADRIAGAARKKLIAGKADPASIYPGYQKIHHTRNP